MTGNSVIPCKRGARCNWPACPQDCDGRPGRDNFHATFTAWLASRGLSYAAAGAALGVSPRTVEAWAQGKPCGTPRLVLRAIELLDRTDGAAVWNDTRVKALTAENRHLRGLVECLLHNDPDDMAADAVTVLDVWRKDAARVLGKPL